MPVGGVNARAASSLSSMKSSLVSCWFNASAIFVLIMLLSFTR